MKWLGNQINQMDGLLSKVRPLFFKPLSEEYLESWDARRIRRERVKAIVAAALYGLASLSIPFLWILISLFCTDRAVVLVVSQIIYIPTFILWCDYTEMAVKLSQLLDDRLSLPSTE